MQTKITPNTDTSLAVMMSVGACLKKNTVPLKILDHCKWPPEIMMVSLKCMAASASLEK